MKAETVLKYPEENDGYVELDDGRIVYLMM